MAESNPWRFECCNQVLNALADDDRAAVMVSTVPFRRRNRTGLSLVVVVTNSGKCLASCRHEVDHANRSHWADYVELIATRAMYR